LVGENISTDQIKKPMRVVFENEPAIDEGGVKKEYFILVFKELFNPEFGMFMYNPQNRLYWFNYQTFESNINFELIGTLLALAPRHQVILDIPILPTCYKILLGEKPSMEDLEMWQPEIAQSFKFILAYEGEQPLQDILARTMTIDFEVFGEKIVKELVPGGSEIMVTQENKVEFVALYISYLFEKLCE
jgi:ubiquitin-protein ligase E3 A